PPARLEAFASIPFITYDESEYVFGKWFEVRFGRQPRVLSSFYHFEELEEVIDMVAAARGWSIVPDHAVARAVRAGAVAVLRAPRERRVHNLSYAVRRAHAPEHPGVTQLLDAVAAAGRAAAAPRRSRR